MRILVATTNLGKIKEFQDIFPSILDRLALSIPDYVDGEVIWKT